MRARLCSYLARCFNAHLTDDEKRFADDVAAARAAAIEFNKAIKKVYDYQGATICTNWTEGSYSRSRDYCFTLFQFQKIEASLNTRKEI